MFFEKGKESYFILVLIWTTNEFNIGPLWFLFSKLPVATSHPFLLCNPSFSLWILCPAYKDLCPPMVSMCPFFLQETPFFSIFFPFAIFHWYRRKEYCHLLFLPHRHLTFSDQNHWVVSLLPRNLSGTCITNVIPVCNWIYVWPSIIDFPSISWVYESQGFPVSLHLGKATCVLSTPFSEWKKESNHAPLPKVFTLPLGPMGARIRLSPWQTT